MELIPVTNQPGRPGFDFDLYGQLPVGTTTSALILCAL